MTVLIVNVCATPAKFTTYVFSRCSKMANGYLTVGLMLFDLLARCFFNLKQHSDYCVCTILKDANYCMEGHFSRKHVAFQTSGQTKMGWTFVYKEFTLSHFAKNSTDL